jgi:hypothetical protein
MCVNKADVCDGVDNCNDASDERNCVQCDHGYFECPEGSVSGIRCLNPLLECDGHEDCIGGHDEKNCSSPCPPHQRKCEEGHPWYATPYGDGTCLNETAFCDGYVDCRDHSDEARCSYTCHEDEFMCGRPSSVYGKVCGKRCDDVVDCKNNLDETDCGQCSGQFYCGEEGTLANSNVTCVPLESRCDGSADCSDGRDERLC